MYLGTNEKGELDTTVEPPPLVRVGLVLTHEESERLRGSLPVDLALQKVIKNHYAERCITCGRFIGSHTVKAAKNCIRAEAQKGQKLTNQSKLTRYVWLNRGIEATYADLMENLEDVSGVRRMTIGEPAHLVCAYCDRPNLHNLETCNGCGAPAKSIPQV